jgi:hypothetical protein
MGIIAKGKEAHECYTRRAFEYLYGRDMVPGAPADVVRCVVLSRREVSLCRVAPVGPR